MKAASVFAAAAAAVESKYLQMQSIPKAYLLMFPNLSSQIHVCIYAKEWVKLAQVTAAVSAKTPFKFTSEARITTPCTREAATQTHVFHLCCIVK